MMSDESPRGRGTAPGTLVTKPRAVVNTSTQEGGSPVRLLCNFIRVVTPTEQKIWDYHVSFDPPIEQHRVRRGLLWEHRELLGEAMVFDGDRNLKLLKKLEDEMELVSTDKLTNKEIKLTLKLTGEVDWASSELMRLLSVQARRNLQHLKYILLGRHFFDPTVKKRINEQNIEIWQGIQTALHTFDGGVMLMSETVHKVVRGETAAEAMQRIYRVDKDNFRDSCRRDLVNCIVMTSYNQKTYKIADISFDKNPLFEFERKGVKISMKEYYKERYNVTINDDRQPLMVGQVSGRKERGKETEKEEKEILLIPSLCQMTGLSEAQQNDMNLRRTMIKMTQADPSRKVEELRKFISDMNKNPKINEEMSRWGVKYDTDIVDVTGKVLKDEKLYVAGSNDSNAVSFKTDSADFSREIRGKSMRQPAPPLKKWSVVVSGRDGSLVNDFSGTLKRVLSPLGCQVSDPTVIMLDNDRAMAYSQKLATIPDDVEMVVAIVPNNNKDRYDAIKKALSCDRAIPSQVVLGKTLSNKKMLMSCCTKIGIQMAVKLGAEPWSLKIPPSNLMVVALTSYKDSKSSQQAGAFVASTNTSITRYYSRVSLVSSKESLSDTFATNIGLGIKRWAELNGRLPERLLIYRDGESEGQIPFVYTVELERVRKEFEKMGDEMKNLRWSYVMVNKRVGARFFANPQPRSVSNPPPGTVIDSVVTRKERFDFFLISQSVRQGTVGPVMFNVLEDLTGFKPVHHQTLAYKLTHLYFNWPGMIKIPAPCQYAYKLAYLTGTHLHRSPHEKLDDRLFYL